MVRRRKILRLFFKFWYGISKHQIPLRKSLKSYRGAIFLFLAICLFLNLNNIYAQPAPTLMQESQINSRGVWVSCFSVEQVLYSKEAALRLINFCKKVKINEIYLQLYRAGQAYYNSRIADRAKYEEIVRVAGQDTIDFLLKEAEKNGIKVFAWINVFSIGVNKKANILAKFGKSILTKDQYLRISIRDEQVNETDKYYLRDTQLFLEPGDPRVKEYIFSIVNEIITNYPKIKGIHLDYIRYPYPIPYLPNSRFNKYGLTYGYGEENIARFKEKTGLDPLTMKDEKDNYLIWDDWKRGQVTAMVEVISKQIKNKSDDLLVSCAVIPSPECAYSVAFQDWSLWLEKGFVDYVVIMNYTRDNRLAKERVASAISHCGKGKIFVGVGAFLMSNEPELFLEQCKIISVLKPHGIVFFSYDDISKEAEMIARVLSQ
ncbi:MAG: family 10 glycosylhydrolase [Candidatus Omnitrophica bacterium]|nr:family 10 glycosylhydrolase [Candidatus Omnitrophota bacterium]